MDVAAINALERGAAIRWNDSQRPDLPHLWHDATYLDHEDDTVFLRDSETGDYLVKKARFVQPLVANWIPATPLPLEIVEKLHEYDPAIREQAANLAGLPGMEPLIFTLLVWLLDHLTAQAAGADTPVTPTV